MENNVNKNQVNEPQFEQSQGEQNPNHMQDPNQIMNHGIRTLRNGRMRQTGISFWGDIVFGLGLLWVWIAFDYLAANAVVAFIGIAISVGGAYMMFRGHKTDMQTYAGAPFPLVKPPYNAFWRMGMTALSLGAMGVLMILLFDYWDNTAWVIFEFACLGLGIAFMVYGNKIDKELMNKLGNPQGDTPQ